MINLVDLHIHSIYSDGSYTIADIIQQAKQKGLRVISICDHDTTNAYFNLPKKIDDCTIIKGIEISAQHPDYGSSVHILGYQMKTHHHIDRLCKQNLQRRHDISLWQIQQLQAHGYPIELSHVRKKCTYSSTIYKQHIMDVMVEQQYCSSIYSSLYYQLFKNNGICMKHMEFVSAQDAINAIHADGGLAFLAHPFLSNADRDIAYYQTLGIDGIETWHSSHSSAQCGYLHDVAKRFNLFECGGSDAHGRYGNEPTMGESEAMIEMREVERWLKI